MMSLSSGETRSASSSDADVEDLAVHTLHTATTSQDEWSSQSMHDTDIEDQHATISTHKLKRRRRQMERTQRKQQRQEQRECKRSVKRCHRDSKRSAKSRDSELSEVTQRMQQLIDNQQEIQKRIELLQVENSQLRQLTHQLHPQSPSHSSVSSAPPTPSTSSPDTTHTPSTQPRRPAAFSGIVDSIMSRFRALAGTNKNLTKLYEWCSLLGSVRVKQIIYVISTICLLYLTSKLNDATNIVSNIAAEHNQRAHAAASMPPTAQLPSWAHMDYSQFTLHHMQRRGTVAQPQQEEQPLQQPPMVLPVGLPSLPVHTTDTVMSASSASAEVLQTIQPQLRATRFSIRTQHHLLRLPSMQQQATSNPPDPFSLDAYFSASTASTIRNLVHRAVNFGDSLCNKSLITSVASILAIIWYCLSNTYNAMNR